MRWANDAPKLNLPTNNISEVSSSNLNANGAKSNFGVYEIKIDKALNKYGKADLDRITQSTGQPTRLHQQLRKLQELNPESIVSVEIINELPNSTTKQAKVVETKYLQDYYDKTGIVPPGNVKSFKPKK